MKILRFMRAGYQTIRQDSVIIKQKSVFEIFENWRSYGKKTVKIVQYCRKENF